jgi:hypothetical protein
MGILEQIKLSVAVAKLFAAAGVIDVFSGLERIASKIGFDHIPLYPQDCNSSNET